jgi:hypothetical protein
VLLVPLLLLLVPMMQLPLVPPLAPLLVRSLAAAVAAAGAVAEAGGASKDSRLLWIRPLRTTMLKRACSSKGLFVCKKIFCPSLFPSGHWFFFWFFFLGRGKCLGGAE